MIVSRSHRIPIFQDIGPGAALRLREVLEEHGLLFAHPLVATGRSATRRFGEQLREQWSFPSCTPVAIGSNREPELGPVRRAAEENACDVVIGVGGGTVVDVAKLAAGSAGLPFLAVPTTLSNDGIASPISVVRESAGVFHRSLGTRMPLGVLVDLDLVRSAPLESTLAGFGDLLSNLSALRDWDYARRVAGERMDSFAALLARTSAEGLLSTAEKLAAPKEAFSVEVLTRLAEGLILSGIAMEIAGSSRPCSGAEHLISHALDAAGSGRPHGVQVAFCTVFLERLDGESEVLENACRRLGLPLTVEELGITPEAFLRAVRQGPSMRPGRPTRLDAMQDLCQESLERALRPATARS